jgi:hypothetical protein
MYPLQAARCGSSREDPPRRVTRWLATSRSGSFNSIKLNVTCAGSAGALSLRTTFPIRHPAQTCTARMHHSFEERSPLFRGDDPQTDPAPSPSDIVDLRSRDISDGNPKCGLKRLNGITRFFRRALRCGCPRFSRNRSSRGWSEIIAVLQWVLPSGGPINHLRGALRHLPRVPFIVVSQTTNLRRVVQMVPHDQVKCRDSTIRSVLLSGNDFRDILVALFWPAPSG